MAYDVHTIRVVWAAWAVAVGLCLGACGPITPEQPEANAPPYIPPDRVRPSGGVVRVDELNGGVITLEVTALLDPNPEEQLFYAWIGDERSVQRTSEVGSVSTTTLHGDRYHTFQSVSLRLDPCQVVVDGTNKETIWLYVSDRPFREVDNEDVVGRNNAYVVSRTWVLEYAPQLCTG